MYFENAVVSDVVDECSSRNLKSCGREENLILLILGKNRNDLHLCTFHTDFVHVLLQEPDSVVENQGC